MRVKKVINGLTMIPSLTMHKEEKMKKILFTIIVLVGFSFHIGNCYPGCSRTIILPNVGTAVEVPGSCGTSYIILPDGRTITVIR